MSVVAKVLNVSEEKIGQTNHEGHVLFSAKRLCGQLGFVDEKVSTASLKKNEVVTLNQGDGQSLYVTESGAYKLILVGENIRAIEAREFLCEDLLPTVSMQA